VFHEARTLAPNDYSNLLLLLLPSFFLSGGKPGRGVVTFFCRAPSKFFFSCADEGIAWRLYEKASVGYICYMDSLACPGVFALGSVQPDFRAFSRPPLPVSESFYSVSRESVRMSVARAVVVRRLLASCLPKFVLCCGCLGLVVAAP